MSPKWPPLQIEQQINTNTILNTVILNRLFFLTGFAVTSAKSSKMNTLQRRYNLIHTNSFLFLNLSQRNFNMELWNVQRINNGGSEFYLKCRLWGSNLEPRAWEAMSRYQDDKNI